MGCERIYQKGNRVFDKARWVRRFQQVIQASSQRTTRTTPFPAKVNTFNTEKITKRQSGTQCSAKCKTEMCSDGGSLG